MLEPTRFWAAISTITPLVILVGAGIWHLHRPRRLAEALNSQGISGRASAWIVAILAATGEFTVGAIGIVALLNRNVAFVHGASVVAGAIFATYAAWSMLVRRHIPHAPCGCTPFSAEMSIWIPLRASALSALAFGGATIFESGASGTTRTDQQVITVAAVVAFSILLWVFPAAMTVPRYGGSSSNVWEAST